MILSFEEAIRTVKARLSEAARPQTEAVPLGQAWRRVLAEDAEADRDYPPFHRCTRDGYAVRAQDVQRVPVSMKLAGEVQAGRYFEGGVPAGACVQVMTGAPLPQGADAVVMLEDTQASGSEIEVRRSVAPFDNVVRRGSEAAHGSRVIGSGTRLGAAELGLLAALGRTSVSVFRRPEVAILSTGDEVVGVDERPEWFQIRNSNSAMLAAEVESAGGIPREMGIAPDDRQALGRKIKAGLDADVVLIAGGVSAGKYDFAEGVLQELGAEFFFDGVYMRPGMPLVFGRAGGRFFFGLPGNPVSAFVTFHVLARPAIQAAGGETFREPAYLKARLGAPLRKRPGFTRFIPSLVRMEEREPVIHPVKWQGSGDLAGLAKANCFAVVHPTEPETLAAGSWIDVLAKPE